MPRVASREQTGAAVGGRNGGGVPQVWTPNPDRVIYFAKDENTRHIRHGQILERWPILAEPWARQVESTRLAAVDRTPGAATFGR
jgi:hypothetical protein